MSRFAPVAPIQLMEELLNAGAHHLGNYHLLLAHDVVGKHEPHYEAVFGELRRRLSHTIIMDNSVVELGEAVELSMIIEAAHIVKAHVLCIPDGYGSGGRTTALLNKHANKLSDLHMDIMFIPQGPGLDEFVKCMESSLVFPFITWWGIPRIAVDWIGTRTSLIELAKILAPNRQIHMLGFSNDVIDDFRCLRRFPDVQGIDSAVPLRAGQKSDLFRLSNSDYGKRGDFWENPGKLTSITKENLRNVRSWAGPPACSRWTGF